MRTGAKKRIAAEMAGISDPYLRKIVRRNSLMKRGLILLELRESVRQLELNIKLELASLHATLSSAPAEVREMLEANSAAMN